MLLRYQLILLFLPCFDPPSVPPYPPDGGKEGSSLVTCIESLYLSCTKYFYFTGINPQSFQNFAGFLLSSIVFSFFPNSRKSPLTPSGDKNLKAVILSVTQYSRRISQNKRLPLAGRFFDSGRKSAPPIRMTRENGKRKSTGRKDDHKTPLARVCNSCQLQLPHIFLQFFLVNFIKPSFYSFIIRGFHAVRFHWSQFCLTRFNWSTIGIGWHKRTLAPA